MKEGQMRLPVLIAQPGLDEKIREKGVYTEAIVDTAASATIVSPEVIESVYGRKSAPEVFVEMVDVLGKRRFQTVPLSIGVETLNGDLICAQVDCIVVEGCGVTIIGNDILTQLELKVTLDYKQKKILLESYNWMSFENEVGQIYRSLGATVKQNINLAGFQIDMVVEEITPSKQYIRLGVECKFYKDNVGNRVVNDFCRIVDTLKQSGDIDKGVIISFSGFTPDARLVADKMGIELLTIHDLRQAMSTRGIKLPTPYARKSKPVSSTPSKQTTIPKRIFVMMPFTPELDDTYYLGIREVIAKMGGSCERADEIQHVGGVIGKIYDSIKNADIIIAELSTPNPNVYYEVGFAHALGKPVILLTKNIQNSPFDLRGYNHVIYSNIVDLRERLNRILHHIMNSDEDARK